MKWIFSHATDDIHHWQLQKERGSGTLSFNPQHLSLRLTGNSKRVFFLRLQGLLQKKVQLHSEYGAQIGETAFADNPAAGQLLVNEQRFFYHRSNAQLFLLDSEKQLFATCELPREAAVETFVFYSLLFGLVWFLTADLQAEKELLQTATA